MKTYQVSKKIDWSFVAGMLGWLAFVLVVLWPVFREWGRVWWIDAMGIGLGLIALGAFGISVVAVVNEATLKLELDSVGLREKYWRGSWRIQWAEVTAWCAVKTEEGDRLIRLKSTSSKEPFDINPALLEGKQFSKICHDLTEHCGPPRPGAEMLDDHKDELFTDVRL